MSEQTTDPDLPLSEPCPRAAEAGIAALPGFEVLSVLGRGGMGVVYKARQVALNRPVALKMILAGAYASEQEQARFRIEAEAKAQLQNPNIVLINEVGRHDGHPYLCLEFVGGGTLEERVARAPQPALCCAELVETLARAVHGAHL